MKDGLRAGRQSLILAKTVTDNTSNEVNQFQAMLNSFAAAPALA